MTIEECREYLPDSWTEIIQQDRLLMEIFGEHDYNLEEEAVPPFLFQELRGGNIEHLRPIFALYGQTGLDMLQKLLMKSVKIQQRFNCRTDRRVMQDISLLDFQKIIGRTLKMLYEPTSKI